MKTGAIDPAIKAQIDYVQCWIDRILNWMVDSSEYGWDQSLYQKMLYQLIERKWELVKQI